MSKTKALEIADQPKKTAAVKAAPGLQISPPKLSILDVPIRGAFGSPLVINAFSEKAREMMRAKQVAGSTGKKGTKREGKDFEAAYHNARHIAKPNGNDPGGWDGVAAASFRHACIDACRLVGFKMTLGKRAVFIVADGVTNDGTPLVRINGEPVPFECAVRNETGVADIRVRPRWDAWSATVKVMFDRDQFTTNDVLNLMMRAGMQGGVGEGRAGSKMGNGCGWGAFELDLERGIGIVDLDPPNIDIAMIHIERKST